MNKQQFTILYQVTQNDLCDFLEGRIENGFEICSVTNTRPIEYPNLNHVPVTDWLIIFRKREND
jgi:hypothetical protein